MDVRLVMFKSNGQRKEFPITNPTTVIGRGENCDLRVPLSSVSRRQCELKLSGQQLRVKDLASSNGTYVNNKRINEVVMKAGDRLVVGPIVFTVQIDGVPEEIKPVKTRGQVQAEAGAPGVEEVVDLEADVTAKPVGAAAGPDALDEVIELSEAGAASSGAPTEDLDPIAALEALASESTKKQQQKK
ncbi:MAG: FHA domain-containing protein [Phycisphaerae bacterium]